MFRYRLLRVFNKFWGEYMITKDSLKGNLLGLLKHITPLMDLDSYIRNMEFDKAAKMRDEIADNIYNELCEKCSECNKEL